MITLVYLGLPGFEERCDGFLQALQEHVDDNRSQ
jgi:hypothetical protein